MSNQIHPSAVLGPGVELGENNIVGPFTVLSGPLRLGDGNWIGAGAVLGCPSEIRGGEHAAGWAQRATGQGVVIGNRNVIREGVTVQVGSVGPTRVGDDCYLMTKANVTHDVALGDQVTVSAGVLIGGHSQVGDDATLGLNAVLHQYSVVGPGAMIGMAAVVTRHVPPFALAFGNPARVRGVNQVLLRRLGLSDADIAEIEQELAGPGEPPDRLREQFAWFESAVASMPR